MKKPKQIKSLPERIRDSRRSKEEQEALRVAEERRRAERSVVAGRHWATEKGDVETLALLERVLMSQPWNAQLLLSHHKIGHWDKVAFAKGAVDVYRAACAEVESQIARSGPDTNRAPHDHEAGVATRRERNVSDHHEPSSRRFSPQQIFPVSLRYGGTKKVITNSITSTLSPKTTEA